jgi:predicted membrane protein
MRNFFRQVLLLEFFMNFSFLACLLCGSTHFTLFRLIALIIIIINIIILITILLYNYNNIFIILLLLLLLKMPTNYETPHYTFSLQPLLLPLNTFFITLLSDPFSSHYPTLNYSLVCSSDNQKRRVRYY